jgi:hypothetical protein
MEIIVIKIHSQAEQFIKDPPANNYTSSIMTTRNLNRTWRDVVFKQYEADLEANEPFPIRYLINAIQWRRDIIINIPQKITLQRFRRSIFTFFTALHTADDPTYEDDCISVRPRKSPPRIDESAAQDEIDIAPVDAPPDGSSS